MKANFEHFVLEESSGTGRPLEISGHPEVFGTMGTCSSGRVACMYVYRGRFFFSEMESVGTKDVLWALKTGSNERQTSLELWALWSFLVWECLDVLSFWGSAPSLPLFVLWLFLQEKLKRTQKKLKLRWKQFSTWSLISLRTLSVTTMEKFFLFRFFHLKRSPSYRFDLKRGEVATTCEIARSDSASSLAGPESVNPRQKYQGHTCV